MIEPVQRSSPVDGFRLAYHHQPGEGPAVVLLHGWPGDSGDLSAVLPHLQGREVVVPDLRGFARSDRDPGRAVSAYGASAQAASVAGLINELGLDRPVVAGYDVGSRVAQQLASEHPDKVTAIVVTPPAPGVGDRVLSSAAQQEFWYQAFHQLAVAADLIDGHRDAVRAYLGHFWDHWSGPGYVPDPAGLDQLANIYAEPGAFVASTAWYRAGGGTVANALAEETPDPSARMRTPTTFVWPEHDPLFPVAWSDRLDDFFADVTVEMVADSGHFVPVEAPERYAASILRAR